MTQRERNLLLVVLVLGGCFVLIAGWFGLQGVLEGLELHKTQVAALDQEVRTQTAKLDELRKAQAKVEQWRAISLPPDISLASSRYQPFLRELCNRHELRIRNLTGGGNLDSAAGARLRTGSLVTPLSYTLQLDGTLARLIGFLREFYALNLPHVIRELEVTPQTEGRLDIRMKIEALSMPTATNRDFLVAVPDGRVLALDMFSAMRHGPIGLGLASWLASPTGLHGVRKLADGTRIPGTEESISRDYSKLVSKNVFIGLAEPPPSVALAPARGDREVLKHVQWTGMSGDFLKTEALLRNRITGKFTRLRAEGGYDSFTIRDGNDREVLKGKVLQLEGRDLVFQVDEKHYRLQLGEFLDQALRNELTPDQLKAMGLMAVAPAENP